MVRDELTWVYNVDNTEPPLTLTPAPSRVSVRLAVTVLYVMAGNGTDALIKITRRAGTQDLRPPSDTLTLEMVNSYSEADLIPLQVKRWAEIHD